LLIVGRGPLSRDVLQRLASLSSGPRVSLVTTDAAAGGGEHFLDPTSPSAARAFEEVLSEVEPTGLVVLALSESPACPPRPWLHDAALADALAGGLERHAAHGGRAPSLLLLSSTWVYGPAVASPLVFDECSVLPSPDASRRGDHDRWAEGLRLAERVLVTWAVRSRARVGVLRAASVVGGPLDSPIAALLRSPLPLRVLGYDPPCQVLHYADLLDALLLAIEQECAEVLNLVGPSVFPLSRLLAAAGVFAPALPGPLADRLAPAAMDGVRLRWRTLADGRRASQLLGFHPRRDLEDSLRA